MKSLKSLTLLLILIFGLTYSPQEPKAISSVLSPNIGGYISLITYCTNPPAINFVSVQLKPPFTGSGSWMFLPVSVPFAYSQPSYTTQPVLGKGEWIYLPCFIGEVPSGPGGLVVLYTGTGI